MKNLCVVFLFIVSVVANIQQPEINDQYETTINLEQNLTKDAFKNVSDQENEIINLNLINTTRRGDFEPNFFIRIYRLITIPLQKLLSQPKVAMVVSNVGTCMVNGALEIVSFYFPAPMIPLIATAAGMIIPFEPVVMLKERMPVTSYRRAFLSAVDSFMGTFNKYKLKDDNDDPYQTMKFNRRLMNAEDAPKINADEAKGDKFN